MDGWCGCLVRTPLVRSEHAGGAKLVQLDAVIWWRFRIPLAFSRGPLLPCAYAGSILDDIAMLFHWSNTSPSLTQHMCWKRTNHVSGQDNLDGFHEPSTFAYICTGTKHLLYSSAQSESAHDSTSRHVR